MNYGTSNSIRSLSLETGDVRTIDVAGMGSNNTVVIRFCRSLSRLLSLERVDDAGNLKLVQVTLKMQDTLLKADVKIYAYHSLVLEAKLRSSSGCTLSIVEQHGILWIKIGKHCSLLYEDQRIVDLEMGEESTSVRGSSELARFNVLEARNLVMYALYTLS